MKNPSLVAPFLTMTLAATLACSTIALAANPLATSTAAEVTAHYAVLAHAMYADALGDASRLQSDVESFLRNPSAATLEQARASYRPLRVSYQQSEVLRFDAENGHVSEGLDADGGPASIDAWEGQVNAWPLDEALIDYVAAGYEGDYNRPANLINTPGVFAVGGAEVDVSTLTPELLAQLNEIGGSEANVTTGIHAVEFLLWGQDIHGTGPGAGDRPASDYHVDPAQGACTSGAGNPVNHAICQRRSQYLRAVLQLLVDDLQTMSNEWSPQARATPGTLGHDFLTRGDGIQRILDSMGDMAVGELASERMKVAILFGSTEDEHDCFSDLTHLAIENNARGVVAAYTGRYVRRDGSVLSGPSLSDLVKARKADTDAQISARLEDITAKMSALSERAESGMRFDQMVGGTAADKALVLQAAEALVALGDPLSNEVAPLLNVQASAFDPGTCPGQSRESCAE